MATGLTAFRTLSARGRQRHRKEVGQERGSTEVVGAAAEVLYCLVLNTETQVTDVHDARQAAREITRAVFVCMWLGVSRLRGGNGVPNTDQTASDQTQTPSTGLTLVLGHPYTPSCGAAHSHDSSEKPTKLGGIAP